MVRHKNILDEKSRLLYESEGGGIKALENFHGFPSGGRGTDAEAMALEQALQRVPRSGMIFREEDSGLICGRFIDHSFTVLGG